MNLYRILVSSLISLLFSGLYAQNIQLMNGWQLKGSESSFNISELDFACIDFVWKYNTLSSSWSAYSPDTTKSNLITNSGISTLTSIDSNDGFWIKGNSSCNISLTVYDDSDHNSDHDDDNDNVLESPSSVTLPTTYSVNTGRLLASQCSQCHGTNGYSINSWDSIAGENDLADEIFDDDPIMNAQAHGYTAAEITLIGNWLQTQ